MAESNHPAAANSAITLVLQIADHWRGAVDGDRLLDQAQAVGKASASAFSARVSDL
jgi:hypothetical protein